MVGGGGEGTVLVLVVKYLRSAKLKKVGFFSPQRRISQCSMDLQEWVRVCEENIWPKVPLFAQPPIISRLWGTPGRQWGTPSRERKGSKDKVYKLWLVKWVKAAVPSLFGTRDRFRGRQFFHGPGDGGWNGFGMIQANYIYCALYFYYCHIVIYERIIQLTIMLTGGGAQVVMRAMGSSCKYRWTFARSLARPLLTSCNLTGCGPVPVHGPGVRDPWVTVWTWKLWKLSVMSTQISPQLEFPSHVYTILTPFHQPKNWWDAMWEVHPGRGVALRIKRELRIRR